MPRFSPLLLPNGREHWTQPPLSAPLQPQGRERRPLSLLAALLCCPMDASKDFRRHRPLHLCCPTNVRAGRRGRLQIFPTDPRMRAQGAAVATLRPSPQANELGSGTNFDQIFLYLNIKPPSGRRKPAHASRETNLGGSYSVASKAIWFHEHQLSPSIIKSAMIRRTSEWGCLLL